MLVFDWDDTIFPTSHVKTLWYSPLAHGPLPLALVQHANTAADLLTEEGRLLSTVQGEDVVDYDIDAYAKRLDEFLDRKDKDFELVMCIVRH